MSLRHPVHQDQSRQTEAGPFSELLSLYFMSILPLSADGCCGHPFPPRHWWEVDGELASAAMAWAMVGVGAYREAGGSTWEEQLLEEPVGDGIVILVIKDRVASMPGVRTGCGKLLESLWGKAAPSLLCPFSGDLIIFSNSQDGILYPLFRHLLLSLLLSATLFLSLSSHHLFVEMHPWVGVSFHL